MAPLFVRAQNPVADLQILSLKIRLAILSEAKNPENLRLINAASTSGFFGLHSNLPKVSFSDRVRSGTVC